MIDDTAALEACVLERKHPLTESAGCCPLHRRQMLVSHGTGDTPQGESND